jgi:hypothetical protein
VSYASTKIVVVGGCQAKKKKEFSEKIKKDVAVPLVMG